LGNKTRKGGLRRKAENNMKSVFEEHRVQVTSKGEAYTNNMASY
jgi:hypothetical protein